MDFCCCAIFFFFTFLQQSVLLSSRNHKANQWHAGQEIKVLRCGISGPRHSLSPGMYITKVSVFQTDSESLSFKIPKLLWCCFNSLWACNKLRAFFSRFMHSLRLRHISHTPSAERLHGHRCLQTMETSSTSTDTWFEHVHSGCHTHRILFFICFFLHASAQCFSVPLPLHSTVDWQSPIGEAFWQMGQMETCHCFC